MATATAKRGRGTGTKAKQLTPPPPKKKPLKRSKRGQGKAPEVQATFLATAVAENPGLTSDDLAAQFNFPLEEVARMRRFIVEYVKDFNPEHAALRMGYPDVSAASTGRLLLYHSYTQLRLQEWLDRAEAASLTTPSRIIAGLVKEANAPDVPFSSNSSTRISALDKLAKIYGLMNPKPKEDPAEAAQMRVMYVPIVANWEEGARASQRALIAASAIDV